MKKSELKAIIKEEIAKMYGSDDAIQKGVERAFRFTPPTSGKGNVLGLPLERLEDYNRLPDTKSEADLSSRNYMYLPSVTKPDAETQIYSKEQAQEWLRSFMTQFGAEGDVVRFAKGQVVNNPKFDEFRNAGKASIASFYDKLKYKGD
jgi:hypothetical protein